MKIPLSQLSILMLLSVIFGGCKKDNTLPSTTSLTKTELLVKYTWQIDEVFRNSVGKNSHYVKSGVNTTGTTYNLVRITFKADGTASYTNDLGQTYPAIWKFTYADEHNMELAITSSANVVYSWNIVEISDRSFSNTTAITFGGSDVLVVARYIPFP